MSLSMPGGLGGMAGGLGGMAGGAQPVQPGVMQGQPSGIGGAPSGLPPEIAAIWQHLPPQLQQLFHMGVLGQGMQGGGGGLLGMMGNAGLGGGLLSLLAGQHKPKPPIAQPMQASGNPFPVPQTYPQQPPVTSQSPGGGVLAGGPGSPYQVPQTY